MLATCVLTLGLVAAALGGPTPPPKPPTFPAAYSATGYILLPYANLTEPFTANYDANLKKSRIDYYNGTMNTYQINANYSNSPLGGNFKIVWSPDLITNTPKQVCYQANATADAPAAPQSVFPDLSTFKYVGEEDCATNSSKPDLVQKGTCSKWVNITTNFERNSTYSFWALKGKDGSYTPVRYVMFGYDSLFGSHYDLYEMIYSSFTAGAQNDDVFDVVKQAPGNVCVPYPAGSGLSSGHLFNPMKTFVHHDESHVDEHFNHFKNQHGKSYSSDKEEALRKNQFRHNQRYIDSMNRKNVDFKLKINHLADLHQDEMKYLRGRKYTAGYNGGKVFPAHTFVGDLPPTVNWTAEGYVSDVKDQAICGSCWSFGTTGHLESMYHIKYQRSVRFSEQQLIDCSWNFGNGACDGGEDFQAYQYIMQQGLSTDQQYGPYLGIDGKCHDGASLKRELPTLLGYVNVTGVDNLKKAVAFIGPISVGIDAAHQSLSFYSHGVYKDPECKNGPQDLDHAVLAVGYGSENGEDYWIIKNSWSTYWGDQGYVKMSMKDNMCGVATAATYAILPDNL